MDLSGTTDGEPATSERGVRNGGAGGSSNVTYGALAMQSASPSSLAFLVTFSILTPRYIILSEILCSSCDGRK